MFAILFLNMKIISKNACSTTETSTTDASPEMESMISSVRFRIFQFPLLSCIPLPNRIISRTSCLSISENEEIYDCEAFVILDTIFVFFLHFPSISSMKMSIIGPIPMN